MKALRNIFLVIIAIFGFQSLSNAQSIEFSTHLGFGWGITNSSSPGELGIGLRFPVADGLAAGVQFGLLGQSANVGGLNLNVHIAIVWESLRLYAGPELLFGTRGSGLGFGAVGGIDFYITDFFGIYAKTHVLFVNGGLSSSVLIGLLLPPEVFSYILDILRGR